MYGRVGLDRFKKAQSSEPFAVTTKSSARSTSHPTISESDTSLVSQNRVSYPQNQHLEHQSKLQNALELDTATVASAQQVSQVGGGQSTWQAPDWAIEPLPGVYYLDVMKEGEVLGRINLDKRRHIFGRQLQTCDFVLEHQSVSRQHAAVVPHKNGGIYVIDLGSVHGTFVANERMTKDTPVELEVGQSLKFAASTRTYILRKNNVDPFRPSLQPTDISLPPPPDPSDEEAVVAYNTYINRVLNGHKRPNQLSDATKVDTTSRASKRVRKGRVSFKDQFGGELVEVVGFSDGADIGTEPGPVGVKEGSLVGKYESLVQITVIPKGKDPSDSAGERGSPKTGGVTEKLRQVLNQVKSGAKSSGGGGGIYDDLYGETFNVGSSWAYSEVAPAPNTAASGSEHDKSPRRPDNNSNEDDDDLFG